MVDSLMFLEQEAHVSRDVVPGPSLGNGEAKRVLLGSWKGTWDMVQTVALSQATKIVMSRDGSLGHWVGGKCCGFGSSATW